MMNSFKRSRSAALLWLTSAMALAESELAWAQTTGGGSLTEIEGVVRWILNIFSPFLLLGLLTLLLIGCGFAVWVGRLSAGLFIKIFVGAVLVFGARTIAPKLIQGIS